MWNEIVPKEKIIFGTGVGYGSSLPVLDSSWHILFVRGPLSAKKLGLSSRDAITDSAMLIRNFYSKANGNLIGFMPHVSQDVQGNFHWRKLCKKLGYLYISPQAEVATVLAQIRSCKLLLSEAMHGAIVADALRVPWIPLASSDVLPFKWLDWCQSLELPYHPIKIPSFWTSKTPLSKVKNCIKFRLAEQSFHRAVTHGPYQSKEHILDDKINQINARLLTIKSLL